MKRTMSCIAKLAGESTLADLTAAVILSELLKKVIQVKHYLQEILTLINLFCLKHIPLRTKSRGKCACVCLSMCIVNVTEGVFLRYIDYPG